MWKTALCFAMQFAAVGPVFADCLAPKWISPAGNITAETRPVIRWTAVAGADTYVLKVLSRVPEGQIVASFDVAVTDPRFVPPTPLADERAKVTVSVAARCAGNLSVSEQTWFLIDATTTCPAPLQVWFKLENGRSVGEWQAVSGAIYYEVRLHSPADGSVLKVLEAREPRATLDNVIPEGSVLSVRPRCARAYGEPVYAIHAR
ncbi:MAG: hypothetical protein K2Y31_07010 [Burkholderiales bacterium]|jgi:hypothetical protein|nr:hypothetical protein [Burkholderiales bacterium]